jgi:membrane carboxypeptidase/penicillin-binding protein
MISAYAMYANGGERVADPVDRIQNRYGETVYRQ